MFTPVPPGWTLVTTDEIPYDVVGWTHDDQPVIAWPNRGIVYYRTEFGEDPYSIITEHEYRKRYE